MSEGSEENTSPNKRIGRGRERPEIWLFFMRGLSPKQVIAGGYAKSTVYEAWARWPSVLLAFRARLKELRAIG